MAAVPPLQPLIEAAGGPEIHLSLPESFEVGDPEQAHALVRCVQEIVTNAVKHAACDNLWIEISRAGEGLEVKARDDGRGAESVEVGHGLTGMRERLERLGGRLQVASEPERGFRVTAWVPSGGGG